MTPVYILIEADEGYTERVIVGGSITDLVNTKIPEAYTYDSWRGKLTALSESNALLPDSAENAKYNKQECDALIAMVNAAPSEVGRYVLESIEPHWQQWTLVIAGV